MKNILVVMTIAVLGLASCSLNEITESHLENNVIGFGTYTGNAASSRASIVTAATMETAAYPGFGVFAYYAPSGDFMFNQLVKWDASIATPAWTYSPIKYWPTMTGAAIDFYAYAPYVETTGVTNNMSTGSVLLPYTVNADIAKQSDLLIACKKGAKKADGVVTMPFIHALSRIGVKVSYLVDGEAVLPKETTITINSITIGESVSASRNATNAFYTGGNVDLSKTLSAADAATLWTSLATSYNSFTYGAAALKDGVTVLTTDVKTVENADDQYLMVIPQNFAALPVTVNYTVTTTAGESNQNNSSVTNNITVTPPLDLKAGTAYLLHLKVGLNAIVLDVDVTVWTNSDDDTSVSF